MNTWADIFWWTLAIVGLAGCGLCAGLETGIYSLNRVRLQLLRHQNQPQATVLSAIVHDPRHTIAALLIATNIFTYFSSSATGILLHHSGFNDWQTVVADVAIITPLVFVFAEVLPKDLFAAYADRWVYGLAPVITGITWVCRITGLLWLITGASEGMMRVMAGKAHPHPQIPNPRAQVGALVKESVGYGLLTEEQSAMVERVLELGSRRVSAEATPWSKVETIRENATAGQIRDLARQSLHANFPIVNHSGDVVGILQIMDALVHDEATCPPLRQLARPPLLMPEQTAIQTALGLMQRHRQDLAIIVNATGKPIGVTGVKDLVEPITGELSNW